MATDSGSRIAFTSSNAVFSGVLATNPPSINVKSGAYSANLAIPAGCNFYSENGTTGITYASIGNGARINEPTFNFQFGGYNSGSYTIATNGTFYLAFKPDNSISYSSANAGQLINQTVATLYISGGGTISSGKGQFPCEIPICVYGGITFRGQGVFDASDGHSKGTALSQATNDDLLYYNGTTAQFFFNIYDMSLVGKNGTTGYTKGSGLHIYPNGGQFKDVHIYNTFVNRFPQCGINTTEGW